MKSRLVGLVTLGFLVIVGVARGNLLGDPGFEGAGGGSWSSYASTNAVSFDFDSSSEVLSGSESLRISWGMPENPIPQYQLLSDVYQEFAVTPGYLWDASVSAQSWGPATVEIYLETIFYDAGMAEVGKLQSAHISGTNGWTSLSNYGVISNNAVTGRFRLILFNGAGDVAIPGDVWFDDASLQVIPEPATFALCGVAALLLTISRRRIRGK